MDKIQLLKGDFSSKLSLVFAPTIKAGFPSPAEDYLHDSLDFNRDLIKHPEATLYGRVSGDSMIDAGINDGDIAVIDRSLQPSDGDIIVAMKTQSFKRGQVCGFYYNNKLLLKRVIATEGDTIEIKDGRVYVNDQMLNEDYILEKTRSEYPKATVPQGTVFVMGDNRKTSEDSRFADVGFVPSKPNKGKAVLVLWPLRAVKKQT